MLDVGCGVGVTAIALASYLSDQGGYQGFDLDRQSIEWCQREITQRYPNFGFTHIDAYNAAYNETGSVQSAELAFPYGEEQFDLVFLFSVFTHLLPEGFEQYCSEIRRVLRRHGRLLASFFLLNRETLASLRSAVAADPNAGGGRARSILERDFGDYSLGIEDAPEGLVAFRETYVHHVLLRYGFTIREPISYGNWVEQMAGHGDRPQDTVVADV